MKVNLRKYSPRWRLGILQALGVMLLLTAPACDFDVPEKFEMPTWFLDIKIPLVQKRYEMGDLSNPDYNIFPTPDSMGFQIEIQEIKKSNGAFDALLVGNISSLQTLCNHIRTNHSSNTTKIRLESKCIKINDAAKRYQTQGTMVDVQRIKPDLFELLILGTHYKNVMNVYMCRPEGWEYSSNGLSEDRGYRKMFRNHISLHNDTTDALLDIETQILNHMTKLFEINL